MKIDVCIITLQRPRMLEACLRGIGVQRLDAACDARILVVDNDPQRSAAAVCARLAEEAGTTVDYLSEPRRGLSIARNAAVDAARPDAAFIAFIDDDEVPQPGWLAALLATQAATDADVVAGPVLSRYQGDPPGWVTAGTLFDHPRHAEGAPIDVAGTGNVLVRGSLFEELRFDDRLALTGGEDRHFFRRAALAGHRMVWSDSAIVHETVPASRLTVRWTLRRFYRNGITHGFCIIDLERSPLRRLGVFGRGLGWIVIGCTLLPVGVIRGRWRAIRALRCIWFGAGHLAALLGRTHEEYREVHGG